MKMHMWRILSLILLLGVSACTTSRKIPTPVGNDDPVVRETSNANIPVLTALKGRYLLIDSTRLQVYLDAVISPLDTTSALELINKRFRIGWMVNSDYSLRDRLATGRVELGPDNFKQHGEHSYFIFEIPRPTGLTSGVLLIEFADFQASKKYTNDFFIDFTGRRVSDRFKLFAQGESFPYPKSYIRQGDSLQIKSIIPTDQALYLVKYKQVHGPAPSPMSAQKNQDTREPARESVKPIRNGAWIQFSEAGFYAISEDSARLEQAFGFLVVDDRYPRLTRPERLTEPVIYMSTPLEIQQIQATANAKQALDMYFLNLTSGDASVAQRTIRKFYQRVEEANEFFTTYKEGWKTDKGMIYTIMGPPNRIQKSRDREIWLYSQSQNFSEILFTFYRKPNQYVEDHYELLRYPEYQSYWFPIVEAWRTGNVAD